MTHARNRTLTPKVTWKTRILDVNVHIIRHTNDSLCNNVLLDQTNRICRCRGNTAWLSGPSKQPPPRPTNQRDPSRRTQPADAPTKGCSKATSQLFSSADTITAGGSLKQHPPRQPISRPTSDATTNKSNNLYPTSKKEKTFEPIPTIDSSPIQRRIVRGTPNCIEFKGWQEK